MRWIGASTDSARVIGSSPSGITATSDAAVAALYSCIGTDSPCKVWCKRSAGIEPRLLFEWTPRGIPLNSAALIKVLCVEDHPVFREGLATVIASQPDMRLIGFVGNGVEAVAEFRRSQPDVTLMDLQLPGSNGTDVLVAIRGEFPRARIVILTTSDGDGEIQRAMRAGAAAYLLKSMAKDDLLAVIRAVHAGRRHVPAEVAARLAEHFGEDDLTARELEVLRLIRDGYRNKQIADQLAIAETTVNFHIKNLVAKLQAKDRTHAVTIALRRGLLQM